MRGETTEEGKACIHWQSRKWNESFTALSNKYLKIVNVDPRRAMRLKLYKNTSLLIQDVGQISLNFTVKKMYTIPYPLNIYSIYIPK